MQISVCNGIAMDAVVVVAPSQQSCPTFTLRVTNTTEDFKRSRNCFFFARLFVSLTFCNQQGKPVAIHLITVERNVLWWLEFHRLRNQLTHLLKHNAPPYRGDRDQCAKRR